jgi:hypothetical protein
MDYEEESSVFQLPTNAVAPTMVFEAPRAPEAPVSSVAEAAKVVPVEQPATAVTPLVAVDKLSDRALFDELNAVSEEVIECRNQILSKIC